MHRHPYFPRIRLVVVWRASQHFLEIATSTVDRSMERQAQYNSSLLELKVRRGNPSPLLHPSNSAGGGFEGLSTFPRNREIVQNCQNLKFNSRTINEEKSAVQLPSERDQYTSRECITILTSLEFGWWKVGSTVYQLSFEIAESSTSTVE